MKKVRYIFPETQNFREVRPRICWEDMYGWLDGYGLLFDPVVQPTLGTIPEWENGWDGRNEAGDFFITPCPQATALFAGRVFPGIFTRPVLPETSQTRLSEKEVLLTPAGQFYYPNHLPFDYYGPGAGRWAMGESIAVLRKGESLAVGFELFAALNMWSCDWPERRLTVGADIVSAMLAELGHAPVALPAASVALNSLRLDCQAFGLNRLFIGWLLQSNGADVAAIHGADVAYLKAVAAWQRADIATAKAQLKEAFGILAKIRQGVSALDIRFLEYPHLGILFEDMGFFELEWPQYSRETMLSYLDHSNERGYKVSLEGGGSCWRNLARRFPSLISELATAWKGGKLELTNGTFSLPYALLSPLALQYWQFVEGGKAFEETFGKRPDTYQCQENSLTPQMPELLLHFGYKRALHISQNHGNAPGEPSDYIRWASPAGHSVPSMAAKNVALSKKGVNFFLDLPLVHSEFKAQTTPLNYVNFQDIGYVPFRVHMIRAHAYADVWGRFSLADECFQAFYKEADAPVRTYYADAYGISAAAFYGDKTNANAFSHYENVFKLWARFRKLRLAAWDAGLLDRLAQEFSALVPALCSLEAHDSSIVQGQRRGEFYAPFRCIDPTPYSRESLTDKVAEIVAGLTAKLDTLEHSLGGGNACFNPAETALPFVRTPAGHVCGVPAMGVVPAPGHTDATPVGLPIAKGKWRVGRGEDGGLSLAYDGQAVSCAPVDRQQGAFVLIGAEACEQGGVNVVKATYQREQDAVQTVVVELVFVAEAPLIEFNIRYAPRNDFGHANRWNDYLALEFRLGSALSKVWRFNPNVRSLTAENRVASPYYLAAQTAGRLKVSLLNEGSFLYELDRDGGTLRWLFHVACETQCQRRAALLFGSDDAFLVSRAWSQGVVAASAGAGAALRQVLDPAASGVSLEDFVGSDTVLVSNLRDEAIAVGAGSAVMAAADMTGRSIVEGRTLRLRPFELAEMKLRHRG